MSSVRGWVAVAATLPLLVVAGCSEDPEPKFSRPSESPSASESSEPPAKEAWEVKSDKGAYAFVRHWVATLNAAGESGDTSELAALSAKDCESCSNIIDYIDGVYRDGGRINSSGWRVRQFGEISDRFPSDNPIVTSRVRQSAQVVRSAEGTTRVPPTTETISFGLTWVNGWQVEKADIVG